MNDSFVFFISFHEAIEDLPDKERLKCYDLIANYALYGVIPEDLSGISKTVFALVRPNIDSNIKKRKGGNKGGRPPKDAEETEEKEKPMVSKTKNHRLSKVKTIGFENTETIGFENAKTNEDVDGEVDVNADEDVNVDADVDADVDITPHNPPKGKRETQRQILDRLVEDQNLGLEMEKVLREWLDYKQERRETYKEIGMRNMISQVQNAVYRFGEVAVMERIKQAMANTWKGMNLDKMDGRASPIDDTQAFFEKWRNA